MSNFTIISSIPRSVGWLPILHMQELLVQMTGAKFYDVSGKLKKFFSLFPKIKAEKTSSNNVLVYIARNSSDARSFLTLANSVIRADVSILWIVDSFWTDHTLRNENFISNNFDFIIHMQSFDDEYYRKTFGTRSLRLDWGSDVLRFGNANKDRPIDLLRIGRQPSSWEDDVATERACLARGLRFAGRPAMHSPEALSIQSLMNNYYSRSKFVLAHSNVAAPAKYTHPSKAYITGRWTDAIACGAAVIGVPPHGDLQIIDWPEALLPLSSLDREKGLDLLASKIKTWDSNSAKINYMRALHKLDWRWRFRTLFDAIGCNSALLNQEISELYRRMEV
ncbi:hypothetical protein [Methylobacterium sp. GC_Met_2]|uniref:hypothetical protein n=1 Tax=Methylobacterium sp. GC_Met_2 TaxID=2937376 RepID=UPI00226B922F|nr:hypothetical protein [Methylobacterium sp. GC_Met_2]